MIINNLGANSKLLHNKQVWRDSVTVRSNRTDTLVCHGRVV